MRFLLCLARAVAKNGFKILADALPFGGALYDVASDAWQDYRQQRPNDSSPQPEAALTTELQMLAQAPAAQVRREAEAVVQEVAAGQLPEVQLALTAYLTQVPAMVRCSLRRPSDLSGTTVPANRALRRPEDLLPFLPPKLPRFKPGDRPLPGVDWELELLLGVGGFGEVWKAKNPFFDGVPPVALKFCLDAAARERLLKHEAAILNHVMRQGRHEGIVPLQHTYLSADPPCLEYEFVDGGDLTGLLLESKPSRTGLPPAEAARVVQRLATIVGFTHRLKPPIVPGDLKPANILVQRGVGGTSVLRVSDFGIGGLAARQAIELTRSGTRNGYLTSALRGACTPLYASPQQKRGDPADPRDDVYSLGVIWYQLLTGDLTRGCPTGRGWQKRLTEQGLSEAMLNLLMDCFGDEPQDRPRDAAVLAEALAKLHAPVAAPDVRATPPPRPVPVREERPAPPPVAAPNVQAAPSPRPVPVQESRPEPSPVRSRPLDTIPTKLAREFTNSLGTKFVLIPAGTFLMGSPPNEALRQDDEGPQHEVEITSSFYLGVYPVTQEEYQRLMGKNPSYFSAFGSGARKVKGLDTRRHPVEQVSWEAAVAFCRKLSEQPEEKKKGRLYRLPSEAEWEYACRGGVKSSTPFCFGDSLSSTQANFNGNYPSKAAKGPYLKRTSPVGSYKPNPFELYDMHGNVWEWCADWYDKNYYKQSPRQDPQGPQTTTLTKPAAKPKAKARNPQDPQGPQTRTPRVLRGGSWDYNGRHCRSAYRGGSAPGNRVRDVGFRLVCVARRTP
jgi:formylglycine-generating enzyme required for sulfatase activity